MTPPAAGRTQECGREQARVRLAQAQAFLEVADLIGDDPDELATPNVAAALAVLAGIAAADAACCVCPRPPLTRPRPPPGHPAGYPGRRGQQNAGPRPGPAARHQGRRPLRDGVRRRPAGQDRHPAGQNAGRRRRPTAQKPVTAVPRSTAPTASQRRARRIMSRSPGRSHHAPAASRSPGSRPAAACAWTVRGATPSSWAAAPVGIRPSWTGSRAGGVHPAASSWSTWCARTGRGPSGVRRSAPASSSRRTPVAVQPSRSAASRGVSRSAYRGRTPRRRCAGPSGSAPRAAGPASRGSAGAGWPPTARRCPRPRPASRGRPADQRSRRGATRPARGRRRIDVDAPEHGQPEPAPRRRGRVPSYDAAPDKPLEQRRADTEQRRGLGRGQQRIGGHQRLTEAG